MTVLDSSFFSRITIGSVMKRIYLFLLGSFLSSTISLAQVTGEDIVWDFECGSLESAVSSIPNDINLTLRLDDLSGDLYGWYYFKITQHALNQTVTFHILNPDNWYNENHKPVYSYDGENWFRLTDTWMSGGDLHFRQNFSCDSVYTALVFPYGYSDMIADLDYYSASPYVEYEYIGESVHGRAIPLATVQNPAYPASEKRTCWIISRQHPMESPPSFTVNGLIEYVIGWGNPGGEEILRYLIFKIVPMVNVDGVAEGLSRHNVNGINLNRCWCSDSSYFGEEPEVAAVHRAIDEHIEAGGTVDLFIDMHAAPDLYDFGYRLSEGYSYFFYYSDINSFLKHLDYNDPFQNWTLWRDLDESYGVGLSVMALYDQHGLAVASSEHSWTRRGNGIYITINGLTAEGQMYANAIFDYLHPAQFTDSQSAAKDSFNFGDEVYVTVFDPDEDEFSNLVEYVLVQIRTEESGDLENLLLGETFYNSAIFLNPVGITVIQELVIQYNGTIEAEAGERMIVIYQDNDFPLDSSWSYAGVFGGSDVEYLQAMSLAAQNISIYPNPFNASTYIPFNLNKSLPVNLSVYNQLGQIVSTLIDKQLPPGTHLIEWEASNYPSGIYFIKLQTPDNSQTIKATLIK